MHVLVFTQVGFTDTKQFNFSASGKISWKPFLARVEQVPFSRSESLFSKRSCREYMCMSFIGFTFEPPVKSNTS